MNRAIFCCGCGQDVQARLTDGKEIYPHRTDLASLPFWRCDTCRNYVGCHHKTSSPTTPLGNIPTSEIRNARQKIHAILDPLWRDASNRKAARRRIYGKISDKIGHPFHTSEIKTLEEAREIYTFIRGLAA